MKRSILLSVITFLLVFTACKKKDPTPANTTPGGTTAVTLVKTMNTYVPGYIDVTSTYTYDGSSRIKSITNSDKSHNDFQYSSNMVTEQDYDSLGSLSETITYFLNSKGLADSTYSAGSNSFFTQKLIYDNNGYLIKSTGNYNGIYITDITMNTITGGNVVTAIDSLPGNNVQYTTNQYVANSKNTIGNANIGKSFLGTSSVSLLKSSNISNTAGTSSENDDYTLDSNSRASKDVVKFTVNGTSYTETITYTYN